MSQISNKFKYYLKRYLFAEIVGTMFAVTASLIAFLLTESKVVAAIAGTWGENIGFYLAIIYRNVRHTKTYKVRSFGLHFRNIFLEFGLSEVLDSFFTRPLSMYLFARVFENLSIAVLLGKITADVLFYSLAVLSVEFRKKWKK